MKPQLKPTKLELNPTLTHRTLLGAAAAALLLSGSLYAGGPYPPDNWPTNIDASKKVHYIVVDSAFGAPNGNPNWTQSLGFVVGGDQTTIDLVVCGATPTFTAKRSSTIPGYINIFDTAFAEWNSIPQVDVLVQVYGDLSVLNPANTTQARTWQIREGTTGSSLETGNTITQPLYATNAYNLKWNWILFSITNKVVNDGFGTNRYIGSIPAGSAAGGSQYSGVNGGTLRFGGSSAQNYLNGVTIHAIAFAEAGAFGTTNDVNQFEPPTVVPCDPVPDSNLVGIDFNAGVTNNLQIVETDNTVSLVTGVGPMGDQRKAIVPNGVYLNFGILNNYLGKPCNPNIAVKVCVDFYDDPAFAGAGVTFGPESYATDPLGCNPGIYPTTGWYAMQGTGQWVRKSWTIGGVNLLGVNTAPLTGGPRFFGNQPVAVSRFYMAALRTSGPLAGQDPLADCYPDPLICQGVYGNYAELDLANSVTNGLDLGNNSGDQTYVVETAGPAGDKRLSVRGNSPTTYNLNFAIVTNALGPTSQGNLHLAMFVTYYDDPALTGQGFRPQVWKKDYVGSVILAFMDPPQNIVLQGTDKWRDAYWEIGAIRLDGVNQSPQAAARFECDSPIHISRVRYQVVRPCGPTAGQNPFFNPVSLLAAPDTNALVRLSWPYHAPQAQLQGAATLGPPWSNLTNLPAIEGGESSVVRLAPTNSDIQFFRLFLTPQ